MKPELVQRRLACGATREEPCLTPPPPKPLAGCVKSESCCGKQPQNHHRQIKIVLPLLVIGDLFLVPGKDDAGRDWELADWVFPE